MLKDLTITEFLEQTASAEPLPGGGCTAALTAALAAGLTEMVANLTIGRKEFQAVEDEMKKIANAAADLRKKLQNRRLKMNSSCLLLSIIQSILN